MVTRSASPIPFGAVALNGAGEMTGFVTAGEWGLLESPVFLTSTMQLGRVYDAACRLLMAENAEVGVDDVMIPVVAECDDSFLNEARAMQVEESDVAAALAAARASIGSSEPPAEGAVGSGTGMACLGHKGGIGTSSRVLPSGHTVAVLVMSNFGEFGRLTVDGVPVGRRIPNPADAAPEVAADPGPKGSCIVVVATDAPVDHAGLRAARAARGSRAGTHRIDGAPRQRRDLHGVRHRAARGAGRGADGRAAGRARPRPALRGGRRRHRGVGAQLDADGTDGGRAEGQHPLRPGRRRRARPAASLANLLRLLLGGRACLHADAEDPPRPSATGGPRPPRRRIPTAAPLRARADPPCAASAPPCERVYHGDVERGALLASWSMIQPPVAPQHPHVHPSTASSAPTRIAWLKDKTSDESLAYLRAERAYYDEQMEPLEVTVEELTGRDGVTRRPGRGVGALA